MRVGTQGYHFSIVPWIFLKVSKTKEEELDSTCIAFQSGVEVAYEAVMKPVEGTILTGFSLDIRAKKKAKSTNDAVGL